MILTLANGTLDEEMCLTLNFLYITLNVYVKSYIVEGVKEQYNIFVSKESYETYFQQGDFIVQNEQ